MNQPRVPSAVTAQMDVLEAWERSHAAMLAAGLAAKKAFEGFHAAVSGSPRTPLEAMRRGAARRKARQALEAPGAVEQFVREDAEREMRRRCGWER